MKVASRGGIVGLRFLWGSFRWPGEIQLHKLSLIGRIYIFTLGFWIQILFAPTIHLFFLESLFFFNFLPCEVLMCVFLEYREKNIKCKYF